MHVYRLLQKAPFECFTYLSGSLAVVIGPLNKIHQVDDTRSNVLNTLANFLQKAMDVTDENERLAYDRLVEGVSHQLHQRL
jgi:hypothetical protein